MAGYLRKLGKTQRNMLIFVENVRGYYGTNLKKSGLIENLRGYDGVNLEKSIKDVKAN